MSTHPVLLGRATRLNVGDTSDTPNMKAKLAHLVMLTLKLHQAQQ